ncbi:hypothetical protein NIR10_004619 [Salmonella enterica]|nr:hypothetical protein [Salmonella enterica]
MNIEQKFFDDVIISLMEMNDRIVALEEMAAEHVAEHEAEQAEFENAVKSAAIVGFSAGEKFAKSRLAPEVEPINWSCRTTRPNGTVRSEFIVKSMEDYEKVINLIERYNAGEIA